MRSDTSPNIGFRVPGDTRRLLEAVAYADLVTKRADATPSDINLSDFVRSVLEDVMNDWADQAGGVEALLENLRQGEIRELEDKLAQIKGLQGIDQKLDAQPPSPRGRRATQPGATQPGTGRHGTKTPTKPKPEINR